MPEITVVLRTDIWPLAFAFGFFYAAYCWVRWARETREAEAAKETGDDV